MLLPTLNQLGRDHRRYGVRPEHYDIFGWRDPAYGNAGAAAAIKAGLLRYRREPPR